MKVITGQPYAPVAFNLQEIPQVVVSVRDWVEPRAIVRPKQLVNEKSQWAHRESNQRPLGL